MNAPVDVSLFARAAKPLASYRKYWAARFGTARFLPMSRTEMEQLGWDSCDITMPFGGFKQSGFGRDRSMHALYKYADLKSISITLR